MIQQPSSILAAAPAPPLPPAAHPVQPLSLPLVPRTPSVNVRSSSMLQLELLRTHTPRASTGMSLTGVGRDRPYTRESTISKSNWPNQTIRTDGGGVGSVTPRPRPRLAEELDVFMRKELFQGRNDDFSNRKTVFERIPVVSEAFAVFIERFHEYRDVLSFIKKEYDDAVAEGHAALKDAQRLGRDQAHASEYFATVVSAERLVYDAHVKQLELKLREEEHIVAKNAIEIENGALQRNEMQRKLNGALKEAEDLASKNKLLTENLRQEAVQRAVMLQQGKKLKMENEKLNALCQTLEQRLKNNDVLYGDPSSPALPAPPAVPPTSSSSNLQVQQSIRSRSPIPPAALHASHDHLDTGGDNAVVVAHDHLLELQAKVLRLQKLLKDEMRSRRRAEEEVATLRHRFEELEAERDGDRPSTPRPRWESVEGILPGFAVSEACSDLLLTKVCDGIKQLVSTERREIETQAMKRTIRAWFQEEDLCESDLVHKTNKHFVGLGTGPHVPNYLRFHGRLRNRKITKGTVERLLKELWAERKSSLRTEDASERLPLDEFYLEWLVRKTGSRFQAIEMAYNIQDVCLRHSYDQDCRMFLQILQKSMSEAAYYDQLLVVDQLKTVLYHKDKGNRGWLKLRHVHQALIRFFPSKPTDNMLKLRFALLPYLEQGGKVVEYPRLFEEDEEGNQTTFIEMVRQQHIGEISEFLVDVEEAIRFASAAEPTKLTASIVRSAVRVADPGIPAHKLGVPITHVDSLAEQTVDVEIFLRNMRADALLVRSTKPVEIESHRTEERKAEGQPGSDDEVNSDEDDESNSIFELRQFDNAIMDELPKTPPVKELERAPSFVGAGLPTSGRKSTLSLLQNQGRQQLGKSDSNSKKV